MAGCDEDVHSLGMRSTATMMFGHVETIEERIEHIFLIRELQKKQADFWVYSMALPAGNESLGLKSAADRNTWKP